MANRGDEDLPVFSPLAKAVGVDIDRHSSSEMKCMDAFFDLISNKAFHLSPLLF